MIFIVAIRYCCTLLMKSFLLGGALSGEVPPTWTSHTNKESVKLVPLKKTDQEFKAVEKNFFASLGNLGVTIINVRIYSLL